MSGLHQAVSPARGRHPRAILGGVCAELADRFGLPVWLLRAPLIILSVHQTWTVLIGYAALTIAARTRLIDLLPPRQPSALRLRDRPHDPGSSLARERFAGLETRLARMEAAVTSDELKLRARFREIES